MAATVVAERKIMKKNKKYWKKQAKCFENQYWDAEYVVALLEEQLRVIRHKSESQAIALEATKRELNYFRQRNIGKKVDVKDAFMPDDYFDQLNSPFHPYTKKNDIPVGVDEATKEVIKESATLPKSPNTTGTSGSGYFYNTTIDFTKPKNKNRWFWNK